MNPRHLPVTGLGSVPSLLGPASGANFGYTLTSWVQGRDLNPRLQIMSLVF